MKMMKCSPPEKNCMDLTVVEYEEEWNSRKGVLKKN